jgi:hypothetical protein
MVGLPAASSRDLDVRAAIELNLHGALERLRTKFDAVAKGGPLHEEGGDDVED